MDIDRVCARSVITAALWIVEPQRLLVTSQTTLRQTLAAEIYLLMFALGNLTAHINAKTVGLALSNTDTMANCAPFKGPGGDSCLHINAVANGRPLCVRLCLLRYQEVLTILQWSERRLLHSDTCTLCVGRGK